MRDNEEFVRYNNKLDLNNDSGDEKLLKKYLNSCPYVLRGTLHIQGADCTLEGYYGVALKTDNPTIRKTTDVSGKQVQKVDCITGSILNMWSTIAKSALHENISASKMSRNIKNKVMYGEKNSGYHYVLAK